MNLVSPRIPAQQSGGGRLVSVVLLQRQRGLGGDRDYRHRVFADHVTAEHFVPTDGRGRTVDEWKARTK